jgi:hypothetical protein
MNYFSILVIATLLVGSLAFSPIATYGHTTVSVERYDIEAGWGIEPPIVGIRNNFVFIVSEPEGSEGVRTGVKHAFKNLDVTAKFGGITKALDINADSRPGHYYSPVIPTKTGSFIINFKGEINDVIVDIDIPIEDVESTAVLDFPPSSSSSNQDVSALKSALSSMQKDIDALKSGKSGDPNYVSNDGSAYDFAIFGLSLGAAGVILAIVAMVKRK